jgi:hypothetical protein
MAIKYTKRLQNIPNGLKINEPLPLQAPKKFTQIRIFGLKTYYLATMFSFLLTDKKTLTVSTD